MYLSVILRIEKLEKENNLLVQCRKNGWRDLSRELEECTKVLEEEAKSESRCCLQLLQNINLPIFFKFLLKCC